jgi:hypothetical protein
MVSRTGAPLTIAEFFTITLEFRESSYSRAARRNSPRIYMVKAMLNGRGDEILDLAKTNLRALL